MHTSASTTELLQLQQRLADSAARADIECHSFRDDDGWHDLSTVADEDQEYVGTALRYLVLRRLIEGDPEGTGKVRFKEQSKAKPVIHDIDACMGMTCDCMVEEGPEEDVPAQEQPACK